MGTGWNSNLWVLEIFPLKTSNFSISSLRVEKKSHQVKSKEYPGQRQVGHLFTAGQKYAWVGRRPSNVIPKM